MQEPGTLRVVQEKSFLRKPITVNKKKLGIGVAKTALSAVAEFFKQTASALSGGSQTDLSGWAAPASNLVETLDAVGLKTEPEELAGRLLFTAAGRAVQELLKDSPSLWSEMHLAESEDVGTLVIDLDMEDAVQKVQERLAEEVADEQLVLTMDFFKNPAMCLPLEAIQAGLHHALWQVGFTPTQAQAIAARFPLFFVCALHDTWRADPDTYKKLLQAMESPFTEAVEREFAWYRYQAYLGREVKKSMMGEAFGLDAVYIPLRAYHLSWPKSCEASDDWAGDARAGRGRPFTLGQEKDAGKDAPTEHVVMLHEAVHAWLGSQHKDDAIRLVCGGPGSGKSSFAKMLAAKLAGLGRHVVFISLADLDPEQKLRDTIGRFLQASRLLPFNPLENPDDPLLLILDGLDELSMQGSTGVKAAQRLLAEVHRDLATFNHLELWVRCLITGRDLAVQAVEGEHHLEESTLHLLPYCCSKGLLAQPSDPYKLLSEDQRHTWWQNYGRATGLSYQGLPDVLSQPHWEEMTGQPLLNYLLAVVYREDPDGMAEATRPGIYSHLLEGVYKRDYAKPYPGLGTITQHAFYLVLEIIALTVWHGDGRRASLDRLKKSCDEKGMKALLEKVLGGVESGLMRLMTAFYFRQALQSGTSETFEFTHKSFGEYLTAMHLVRTLREENDDKQRKDESGRRTGLPSAWDPKSILRKWIELCSAQPMDIYLYDFMEEIIAEAPQETVMKWQELCATLLSYTVVHGMPMDEVKFEVPSFKAKCQQARNAETALLAMHYACGKRTLQVSELPWNCEYGLQEWLSWLEPAGKLTLARLSLGYLDFSGQLLDNNRYTNICFNGAKLSAANFAGVDLTGANFIGAHLDGIKLSGAQLKSANFMESILNEAKLLRVYATNANFTKSDLRGANLWLGDFSEATFEDSLLSDADLRAAIFRGASLIGAGFNDSTQVDKNIRDAFLDDRFLDDERLTPAVFDDPALCEAFDINVDLYQLSEYRIGSPTPEQAAALEKLVAETKAANAAKLKK